MMNVMYITIYIYCTHVCMGVHKMQQYQRPQQLFSHLSVILIGLRAMQTPTLSFFYF